MEWEESRMEYHNRVHEVSFGVPERRNITTLFLVFLYIPGFGMVPCKGSADWTINPEDLTHLLDFLYKQRSRIGDGGNWDKTVMNEPAAHMASNWPPKKGGPKTADSIVTKWKATRKLYNQILQAKQTHQQKRTPLADLAPDEPRVPYHQNSIWQHNDMYTARIISGAPEPRLATERSGSTHSNQICSDSEYTLDADTYDGDQSHTCMGILQQRAACMDKENEESDMCRKRC
ncbi:hypothetical protein C8R44DRAFT_744760 [Mycena epipterygia]|nr:hypothetical protein C8R44DRAFT_744760 [Mycena epipterygia]